MEISMWLIIAGGVIAGSVGLGALYDYRARRRGRDVSFGSSPSSPSLTAEGEHNGPII
jgi:hypothetical protein